jgi:hypothetical protein
MPEILTFEKAIDATSTEKHCHVLLGNGFSRACRDDIFAYSALFEQAQFDGLSPSARSAFEALKTTDFEVVIRVLRQAAAVSTLYLADGKQASEQMLADAEALRELLAATIARNHPNRPGEVALDQYQACKVFLSNFERFYTVNYDLLLYWTLMQSEIDPQVKSDDGFRQPDDGVEEYVSWEIENSNKQCVYYLHGALHLFDAGYEIQKYTWSQTGIALVDQIRAALRQGRFPIFVAEGTSKEKRARIKHLGFLERGLRSFAEIGGALFIHGHGLAASDEHILRLIDKGRTKFICVGIFGDPASDDNQRIIRRAEAFNAGRKSKYQADIRFYDASSAKVWG